MNVLHTARDNITDEEFELFIWERPLQTLQLIQNLEENGGSVVNSIDQVLIPFIMKIKQKCDQEQLEKIKVNRQNDNQL